MTSELGCDVLLLSAGLGERLRPLTKERPKPLVLLGGKPLIEYNLELVRRSGAKHVFINLHYLGEQIRAHVGDGSRWGLSVEYSEEPVLLDTGGAVRAIEDRFTGDTLLILNSDIVVGPDLRLQELIGVHRSDPRSPVVTALLRADTNSAEYGEVGVDGDGQIVTFRGVTFLPSRAAHSLMFTGIQVLSRRALDFMPPRGSIFSITRGTWVELLKAQECLVGYRYDGYWSDIGTPAKLDEASKQLGQIFS